MNQLSSCPVCGSESIRATGVEEHDGLQFATYTCMGCESAFSAYDKFRREQNKRRLADEAKRAAEAEASAAAVPASPPPVSAGGAAGIYKRNLPCVVTVEGRLPSGVQHGSGVIISPEGYMITNAHVVTEMDAKHKSITDLCEEIGGSYGDNGYHFGSDFIYADPALDLALLKIDVEEETPAAEMSQRPVETGEAVYAIGNSKGEGICIVEGIVSDARRMVNGHEFIMVTAPVTTGNSGGPVFDAAGELIGIVCCGRNDVATMNYIIPIDCVQAFLQKAAEQEGIEL